MMAHSDLSKLLMDLLHLPRLRKVATVVLDTLDSEHESKASTLDTLAISLTLFSTYSPKPNNKGCHPFDCLGNLACIPLHVLLLGMSQPQDPKVLYHLDSGQDGVARLLLKSHGISLAGIQRPRALRW